MSDDGVWYINDSAAVIDPSDYVSDGKATVRIRRAVRNYAYYGHSTSVTLWARTGSPVSPFSLISAVAERSLDPLPDDVPRPEVAPIPVTPSDVVVPVPSGALPYPYGMPVYNSRDGVWVWVKVDVKASSGFSSGVFPTLYTYPSGASFPGS